MMVYLKGDADFSGRGSFRHPITELAHFIYSWPLLSLLYIPIRQPLFQA